MFLVLFKKENNYIYKDLIEYNEERIKEIATSLVEENITLTVGKHYESKITFPENSGNTNKIVQIDVEVKTNSVNLFGYDNSHVKLVRIGELMLVETKLEKQIELTDIKKLCQDTKRIACEVRDNARVIDSLRVENENLKNINSDLVERNKQLNSKFNKNQFANVYKKLSEVSIEQLSSEIKNHPLVKAKIYEYKKECDIVIPEENDNVSP